ncbi:MAG TPA: RNA 2',3'-cyclic phosphodiesterase [Caulobacteraceae bacterium]|nr:RNA 2',3'-cyclic phosphodiesterase [Caulobacteraceae bacterium]
MIRLFVGLAVPEAAAEMLAPLAGGVPGARWSPPESLHITLRFAGEIAESVAEDLDSALSAVTVPAFDVTLAGVGAFGDPLAPHAIWAGVEASEILIRLRRRCETAARRAGLKPDTRSWKPHVTLAYLGATEPARVAAWTSAHSLLRVPPFRADAFGLYSSWRSRTGSVYRLERRYPLTPAPRGPSGPPAG